MNQTGGLVTGLKAGVGGATAGGKKRGAAGGGWVGVHGPEMKLVGERGPEYVIPNNQLGGGGGMGVTIQGVSAAQIADMVDRELYYRRPDLAMSEEEFSAYCAKKLEEMILAEGPDTVAAFIGEPVLGTGGIVPPPAGYWAAIQEVLAKYDVLLIADEVVTGFGRLGTMFGSEHYGMKPDIITIAKGLTSAYAPLSGSIIGEKVWEGLMRGTDENGPIGHGWTYSAHPIGAAAGVANLKLIDELGLVENAGKTGAALNRMIQAAVGDHPHVGEVRGEGMLCAVEFVEDRETRRFFDPSKKIGPAVAAALLKRGIIGRAMPQGDILGFAPPLCLSEAEAKTIADATAEVVKEVRG